MGRMFAVERGVFPVGARALVAAPWDGIFR